MSHSKSTEVDTQFIQHDAELYLDFLRGCPVAVCLINPDSGEIIATNRPFRLLTGLENQEEKPSRLRIHLKDGDLSEERIFAQVQDKGHLSNKQLSLQVNRLPERSALVQLLSVNYQGHPCILAYFEEISGQKQMEQALREARDAALESARLKSEFLANISHEIRTPLNGIIGMTCLLQDTRLSSLQKNFAETIRLSADNLMTIINEILDFSKLEAGKLVVENVAFDLLSTLETTLDLLAERAQSKGLEISYLVQKDVPCAVKGDPGRLRQVLTNLIGNAVKFTDKGGIDLVVSLDEQEEEHAIIRFHVADTGIGIPEIEMANIFKAFHQADASTARRFGGTGLGLTISRQLAEMMGGKIGAESVEGEGSRFWFTVRLEKRDPDITAVSGVVPSRISSLRVLLVEHQHKTAEHMIYLLKHHGIATEHAINGREALEMLRQAAAEDCPFQLAIIDRDISGIDGLSLSRSIKADPSIASTRLLILTTLTHTVETNILHASHIGGCLTKPLKQSKLIDYLSAAMSEGGRSSTTDPKPPAETEEQPSMVVPHRPIRILIAEDNPINQKVAKGLLARYGYPSEIIPDGQRLLRALELSSCDIILMDCQLPELDGYSATRQIREKEEKNPDAKRIYIIAMTAHAAQGAREKCIASGMDDYISKPIRLEELQAVLRRAVEHVNISSPTPDRRAPSGYLDPGVMETLKMLRSPNQADPVPSLIDEFIQSAESHFDEIHSAIVESEIQQVERLAHSLRGSASGIGALRLADLCGDLETQSSNGSLQNTSQLILQMESEFERVRSALEFEKLQ